MIWPDEPETILQDIPVEMRWDARVDVCISTRDRPQARYAFAFDDRMLDSLTAYAHARKRVEAAQRVFDETPLGYPPEKDRAYTKAEMNLREAIARLEQAAKGRNQAEETLASQIAWSLLRYFEEIV